ncbi:MAG: hypothetical protein NTW21_28655 [Verrucomicrobia bacterium]|nr:hypothetical protein [Verrucomicrobiota bacterium]
MQKFPYADLLSPGTLLSGRRSPVHFYVDAGTANPFEALEKYGWALREATGAKPNVYDFPTVCAWYAGVWKTSGAQDHPGKSAYKINTSSGLVEEAQKMKESGFSNYSRAAVRLVPDSYTEYNPQGWWDDAHWQKHGYYTAPYETSEKLGQGMRDAGCLAFTYIQPQIQFPKLGRRISRDFREAHPDWLLNKELGRNLDFSLPHVQEYVRARFNALRGNIDGFMVDYCDELWMSVLYGHAPEERLGRTPWESVDQADLAVRLADPKITACAVYRAFFKSLRQGSGPDARIHERSLIQPNNELTLGIVDSFSIRSPFRSHLGKIHAHQMNAEFPRKLPFTLRAGAADQGSHAGVRHRRRSWPSEYRWVLGKCKKFRDLSMVNPVIYRHAANTSMRFPDNPARGRFFQHLIQHPIAHEIQPETDNHHETNHSTGGTCRDGLDPFNQCGNWDRRR